MERITRWLARLAARSRNELSLEAALLGGRFTRYAFRRLAGFLLGRSIGAVTHVLESTVLLAIFADRGVVASLAWKNASLLGGAFWWGALEVMRSEIRADRSRNATSVRVGKWLGASIAVASLALVVPILASVIAWSHRGRPAPILDAYALVCGARLGIDVVVRTLYSGVYALQRIPRPLVSTLVGEPLGLVLVVLLWPQLGGWSFPLGLLGSVVVSRALAVRYTLRSYARLRIPLPKPRFRLRRPSAVGNRTSISLIIRAGLANLSTRLGSMLVLAALLGPMLADDPPDEAVVALHLCATLLGAAGYWSQSFYPDFKRLEPDACTRLQKQLLHRLLCTGIAAGAVLWLGSAIVILSFTGSWSVLPVPLLLAPSFFTSAILSVLQLRDFARGRFLPLLASSVPMCAGLCGIVLLGGGKNLPTWVSLMTGSVIMAVVVLWALTRSRSISIRDGVLPHMFAWARALTETAGPVRVVGLATREAASNHCRLLASRIADRLGPRGASVVVPHLRRVLFFERTSPFLSRVELLALGAGKIESVVETGPAENGRRAMEAATRLGVLGDPAIGHSPPSRDDLMAMFHDAFGNRGMVADLTRVASAPAMAALPNQTLRAIWQDAVRESRLGMPKRQNSGFEVSSYRPGGEMRILFIVPRTESLDHRRAWRDTLRTANWAASTAIEP